MPKSFYQRYLLEKKIPNWKEYQLRSPDNKTFKQPSCADAAGAMINGYTVEKANIKGKKPKHWYNIVTPIMNYIKSGYIYYTKQRGFEKYKELIEQASVVAGKDHVIKVKRFDEFAKKVLKKAVEDTVKLKSYELTKDGNYKVIPNSQNKDVPLKKVNRLHMPPTFFLGMLQVTFVLLMLVKLRTDNSTLMV